MSYTTWPTIASVGKSKVYCPVKILTCGISGLMSFSWEVTVYGIIRIGLSIFSGFVLLGSWFGVVLGLCFRMMPVATFRKVIVNPSN